jgi:hypothetical protein
MCAQQTFVNQSDILIARFLRLYLQFALRTNVEYGQFPTLIAGHTLETYHLRSDCQS